MPYCPECGNDVEEDQGYCDECGHELTDSKDGSESSSSEESEDSSEQKANAENIDPRKIATGVAIISLFLILSVVYSPAEEQTGDLLSNGVSASDAEWTSLPVEFGNDTGTQSRLQVTLSASDQLKQDVVIQDRKTLSPGEEDEITVEGVSPGERIELNYNYEGEDVNMQTIQFTTPHPSEMYNLSEFFVVREGARLNAEWRNFPFEATKEIGVRNRFNNEVGIKLLGGYTENQYYRVNISQSHESRVTSGITGLQVDIRVRNKTANAPTVGQKIDVPVTAKYAGIEKELTVPVWF